MKHTKVLSAILLAGSLVFFAGSAMAATSVSWTTPPNGSTYALPATVQPTGQASATGTVGGTGLDLALVLDSSGSMSTLQTVNGVTKTRGQWQKDAAIALVNSLPVNTTSVSVIQFDSSATTVKVLTALNPNISQVIAAINSVDENGGTTIGTGIDRAAQELTGAHHTAGRSQMMVVMSDGETSGNPEVNAANAIAAGVDAIHTVGLPGHSVTTMKDIADGPDDTVGTADDYGVYTNANDLSTLIGIFNGTSGSLVGIDHVTITLPDGTILNSADGDFVVSGIGTFQVPSPYWDMADGPNTFVATAYATDGSSVADTIILYGEGAPPLEAVPEPGTVVLVGSGLIGAVLIGRKKSRG